MFFVCNNKISQEKQNKKTPKTKSIPQKHKKNLLNKFVFVVLSQCMNVCFFVCLQLPTVCFCQTAVALCYDIGEMGCLVGCPFQRQTFNELFINE